MRVAERVVYIGPEAVVQGLEGKLIECEDRSTQSLALHFQPECEGIRAIPCAPEHVRAIARTS